MAIETCYYKLEEDGFVASRIVLNTLEAALHEIRPPGTESKQLLVACESDEKGRIFVGRRLKTDDDGNLLEDVDVLVEASNTTTDTKVDEDDPIHKLPTIEEDGDSAVFVIQHLGGSAGHEVGHVSWN